MISNYKIRRHLFARLYISIVAFKGFTHEINKVEMKTTDVKNALALTNDTFKLMQIAFADLSQRRETQRI